LEVPVAQQGFRPGDGKMLHAVNGHDFFEREQVGRRAIKLKADFVFPAVWGQARCFFQYGPQFGFGEGLQAG
jgi:hypothetical protein